MKEDYMYICRFNSRAKLLFAVFTTPAALLRTASEMGLKSYYYRKLQFETTATTTSGSAVSQETNKTTSFLSLR